MTSNLQERLSSVEVAPPPGAWDKIATALDEKESLSERLLRFEVTPPARTWNAIDAALDTEKAPAKAVPLFSVYRMPLRYIAAASVVAVLLVALNLGLGHNGSTPIADSPRTSVPAEKNNPERQPTAVVPGPDQPSQQISALPSDEAGQRTTRASGPHRLLGFIRPLKTLQPVSVKGQFVPRRPTEANFADFSSLDDFMVFSDGDGTVMRLPKKLFHLVCCEDGDNTCKERLRKLRQKLAVHMTAPDFAGVLDQLRQLQ